MTMRRAAITVYVFGIYLAGLGATLAVTPNTLLRAFGIEPTDEVWIRVLGTVLLYVGIYYVQAARHRLVPIFRASVLVRLSLIFFLLAFVLFADAEPVILLFGLVDAVGALWTASGLRRDAARSFRAT
jgi:hypothetical protein